MGNAALAEAIRFLGLEKASTPPAPRSEPVLCPREIARGGTNACSHRAPMRWRKTIPTRSNVELPSKLYGIYACNGILSRTTSPRPRNPSPARSPPRLISPASIPPVFRKYTAATSRAALRDAVTCYAEQPEDFVDCHRRGAYSVRQFVGELKWRATGTKPRQLAKALMRKGIVSIRTNTDVWA
ncbi:hypothetical protein KCP69_12555 [Salmonella enterica subsp. enterica]|nr:hypothetical protein KCP69_12555 [Salmonella enterica subsp. enterica]